MFRRRQPRRLMRAQRGRRGLGRRRAPKELIRAHQMMQAGNYQEAASRFEKIARKAESRGGPRAPQFFLQAGRTRILAGDKNTGFANLKYGLFLLVGRADWPHLKQVGNSIVLELKQNGLTTEADEISKFLKANLPGEFNSSQSTMPVKTPVLPTHCPSCGGAIRPDEVDWLDEITVECVYCGSPVREEK